MRYKRLQRVYMPKQGDFGVIGRVDKEGRYYIVRPEGASFTYKLKEKDIQNEA